MDELDTLLARMRSGDYIASISLPDDNVADALQHRSADEFSSEWMRVFRVVESAKRNKTSGEDSRVRQLRELSYLQSYHRWHHPDLSAYISDDFGLIGDALEVGHYDPLLDALFSAYASGTFPVSFSVED